MHAIAAPAATVPAPRLRARPVNTSHIVTTKAASKASLAKHIASPKLSTVRSCTPNAATTPAVPAPLTTAVTSSSATCRARSNVKPVAPGRVQTVVTDENGSQVASAGSAPLTFIPANTSHFSVPGKLLHPTATATTTTLKKTSSRKNKVVSTPVAVQHNSRCASRLDSVCSSLPGSGSDRGSVHRLRVPLQSQQQHQHQPAPPVPHPGQVPRTAPFARAATAECIIRSSCQSAAGQEDHKKMSSPPESKLCNRVLSAHDLMVPPPPSPRRAVAPIVAVAPPVPGRTFASAPASRVSSVNSRLAEGKPATTCVTRGATRMRVVRTAGKRSASSNSEVVATSASRLAPAAVASNPPPAVPAAFATAPPRPAGVRPLLSASRRTALKESGKSNICASRLRSTNVTATTTATPGVKQAEASGSRSARTASRQAPLSGQRVAGSLPSRKAARKPSGAAHQKTVADVSATATACSLPPPPSKFQQTHTGCPPPLSFESSVRGINNSTAASAAAAPKGPVSPIRRTSTACPSGAQMYPAVPLCEEYGTRDSASLGTIGGTSGGAAPDSAFLCPWLRPGTFSTPTNRDGGRESSEAPTVPYEGSTGQRASISLSPRTDVDSMSVSGRLSHGM